MEVFAQGIELIFQKPEKTDIGFLSSHILHPAEVDKIPYFLRPAPDHDTRLGYEWSKELERIETLTF